MSSVKELIKQRREVQAALKREPRGTPVYVALLEQLGRLRAAIMYALRGG